MGLVLKMDFVYSPSDLLSLVIIAITMIVVINAMLSDFRDYIIPNSSSILILFAFLAFAGVQYNVGHVSLHEIGSSLITGVVVFLIGFTIYLFGQFGAGDVKLLSCLSLWAGMTMIVDLLLIMALSGGFLAIAYMVKQRRNAVETSQTLSNLPSQVNERLPYGIAIGLGGLYVLAMHVNTMF